MYTAVVFDHRTHDFLKDQAVKLKPEWEAICHHCTFHMGPMTQDERTMEGQCIMLSISAIGESALALAYNVEHIYNCDRLPFKRIVLEKQTPHITLAVNRKANGKPVDANKITSWTALPEPIIITGRLREVA